MDRHDPPTIIPMISYADAAAAIEWLERAFGFTELRDQRQTDPHGRVTHAELGFDGGRIMVATPTPAYHGPRRHAAECETAARWLSVPWVVDGALVHVADRDAHMARAREAGATILGEPADEPFGRLYRAEDLEGHRWMFLEARHP